jgi:hypothetical protein
VYHRDKLGAPHRTGQPKGTSAFEPQTVVSDLWSSMPVLSGPIAKFESAAR